MCVTGLALRIAARVACEAIVRCDADTAAIRVAATIDVAARVALNVFGWGRTIQFKNRLGRIRSSTLTYIVTPVTRRVACWLRSNITPCSTPCTTRCIPLSHSTTVQVPFIQWFRPLKQGLGKQQNAGRTPPLRSSRLHFKRQDARSHRHLSIVI